MYCIARKLQRCIGNEKDVLLVISIGASSVSSSRDQSEIGPVLLHNSAHQVCESNTSLPVYFVLPILCRAPPLSTLV